MLSYDKFITEGVYDPNIFKAFFLAGGPGSGKSYVQRSLFTGTGMKLVNSDTYFANALRKAGMSLDLRNVNPDTLTPMRDKSKKLTGSQLDKHIENRLGIIVDGTGRDYDRLAGDMAQARRVGYDCYMIFVNTTLEVALERNGKRERKIAPSVVENNWKGVQSNLGKFQRLFGMRNMMIVDNSKYNDNETNAVVYKSIRKLLTRPPSTWQAKAWIKKELDKKRR